MEFLSLDAFEMGKAGDKASQFILAQVLLVSCFPLLVENLLKKSLPCG